MIAERIAPEQHDSLPGIAEPAENQHLTGHAPTLERLFAAFRNGRLHHALLLHGPRGIGKATLAFHLARRILLETAAGDASPEQLFRQTAIGAHPALLHLARPADGDKFRTAITVDEIRRIGNLLAHTAHDRGHRIVIIDPAEDMNSAAANALLKNLEEPPPSTLFLLVSHRPGALLATIRSRCLAVRLQPLDDAGVVEVLERAGIAPAEAGALAAQAGGSPRAALTMALNGGSELAAAVNEILQSRPFDMEKAHRLGEAVAAREAATQFSLLGELLLERIAESAVRAGEAGAIERSARLAELWLKTNEAIRTTETFHLDRRQQVVATLLEIRAALDGAG